MTGAAGLFEVSEANLQLHRELPMKRRQKQILCGADPGLYQDEVLPPDKEIGVTWLNFHAAMLPNTSLKVSESRASSSAMVYCRPIGSTNRSMLYSPFL